MIIIKVPGILIGNSTLLGSTQLNLCLHDKIEPLHHFVGAKYPSQLHIQAYLLYREKKGI